MITQERGASSTVAKYSPKNYEHLIGMPGFSEKLLTDHFKLYQGYVTNTNTALEKLLGDPSNSEVRRRLGWEFNGMRLHEYYFENLGGKEPVDSAQNARQAIEQQFGGFENWKKDFLAAGAMRGIGWVILYKDTQANRLINFWIEEHNANHLAGGTPLLVMDVFEHAYMRDYGTDRAKYLDAFFQNINWDVVSKRFK